MAVVSSVVAVGLLGLAWYDVGKRYGAAYWTRPSAIQFAWGDRGTWDPVIALRFSLRGRPGASPPQMPSVWWVVYPSFRSTIP